jgi:hypothetical protein
MRRRCEARSEAEKSKGRAPLLAGDPIAKARASGDWLGRLCEQAEESTSSDGILHGKNTTESLPGGGSLKVADGFVKEDDRQLAVRALIDMIRAE